MNRQLFLFLPICFLFWNLAMPADVQAQSAPSTISYQWLITISATSQANLLNFSNSSLTPAFEADVSMQSSASATPAIYEKFWGAQGNTLGLQRSFTYNIPAGNTVAIKIVHDSTYPSHSENQLVVSALLRVLLDTQVNTNPVLYVTAPSDCYADLINCFEEQNFQNINIVPETVIGRAIPLLVVDETGKSKTNLYYPL